MSFTYLPELTNPVHQVRFHVQDKDPSNYILEDEEITVILTGVNNDITKASIKAAEAILAHYARSGQVYRKQVGDLKLDYFNPMEFCQNLLKELRRRNALSALPFAGGISKVDKEARESDTDRVEPKFTKGLHDGGFSFNSADATND
jgi:hypothetical protein